MRSRKTRDMIGSEAEADAERGPGTLPVYGTGGDKTRARKPEKQEKNWICIIPLIQTAA